MPSKKRLLFHEYMELFNKLRNQTLDKTSHVKAYELREQYWQEAVGRHILVRGRMTDYTLGKLKAVFFASNHDAFPCSIQFYRQYAENEFAMDFDYIGDLDKLCFVDEAPFNSNF